MGTARGHVHGVAAGGAQARRPSARSRSGRTASQVRAFVARAPEQDADRVHRWLLERNLRLGGVAFCRRPPGRRLPRRPAAGRRARRRDASTSCSASVAETADASFDPIVAMGFADSIRREWAWRRSRGESTANLAAFTATRPGPPGPVSSSNAPELAERPLSRRTPPEPGERPLSLSKGLDEVGSRLVRAEKNANPFGALRQAQGAFVDERVRRRGGRPRRRGSRRWRSGSSGSG